MARPKGSKMTEEHKAALAEGRRQGRIVRDYLQALEADSRPGRKASPETLRNRINDVEQQIDETSDPANRLTLVQKRLDLQNQLESLEEAQDIEALEKDFVSVAAQYGERKGLSYSAWREIGVPAKVLKQAGITRATR